MLYRLMKDNRLYFKGKGRKKTVSAQRNGIKISTEGENKVSVEKRWGAYGRECSYLTWKSPHHPFLGEAVRAGPTPGQRYFCPQNRRGRGSHAVRQEKWGRGPAGNPRRYRETKAAAMPSAMLRRYARIKETGPKDCCPSALPWVLWVWQALGRGAMPRLPL